jgi:hypothetical protein
VTDCAANREVVLRVDQNGMVRETIREARVTNTVIEGFARALAVGPDRVFVGLSARGEAPGELQSARIVALDPHTLRPVDE